MRGEISGIEAPVNKRAPKRQISEKTAVKRAERQIVKRRKLLEAAAKIIGQHGYAGCSVSRIASKARIAHGTFYLYFKSQQELFDMILPTVGLAMLDEISNAIGDATDPIEIERRGFGANVQYTIDHVYMNRVLFEGQLYTPSGYETYFSEITKSYVRSLKKSVNTGQFANASDEELTHIATMLINARTGLLFKITKETRKDLDFVESLVASYIKFVKRGLDVKRSS
ncbi:MAG TPA: TetR/AcrR family transcriptional regulator [Sphingopyxis sp.]|nr:TetR/AcrR family transcriptional regulator [Sphingopyxis sp.]